MRFVTLVGALLCSWVALSTQAQAQSRWLSVETPGFVVYAAGSERRATDQALQLEQFDGLLRRMTNAPLAGASGVELSPDGALAYVGAAGDDAVSAFGRNTTPASVDFGKLTFLSERHEGEAAGLGGAATGLDGARQTLVSPDGQHLYVASAESDAEAMELLMELAGKIAEVNERVTHHDTHFSDHEAMQILASAGVEDPQRVLGPLMRAALDNALRLGDAALTGPVARGDVGTVEDHLRELDRLSPEIRRTYVAMARATALRALDSGRLRPASAEPLLETLADRTQP